MGIHTGVHHPARVAAAAAGLVLRAQLMSTEAEMEQRRKAGRASAQAAVRRAQAAEVLKRCKYPSEKWRLADTVEVVLKRVDGTYFTCFRYRKNGRSYTSPGIPATVAEVRLWEELMKARG